MSELDLVQRYGKQAGWDLKPKTILVEGYTDESFFRLVAQLHLKETQEDLLRNLAIIPAGERDRGGVAGVSRELVTLRNLSRNLFSESGRPIYRFIGLFDNDKAGQMAINNVKYIDTSITEYRDVFRLQPEMPMVGPFDAIGLRKRFEEMNKKYGGLNWEVEDFITENFFSAFKAENSNLRISITERGGKIHRDFDVDGKARLHRFIKQNAMLADVESAVTTLRSLRFLIGLVP